MNKTIATSVCLTIFILCASFFILNDVNENDTYSSKDVVDNLKIDNSNLNITYINGNMLDESITYGNTIEKKIKLSNGSGSTINYAIGLSDSLISNEDMSYTILESNTDDNYKELQGSTTLKGNMVLMYNLAIQDNKVYYIKVIFKSNHEGETTIKGKLTIQNNITEKELFKQNISDIQDSLVSKIDSLNGINTPGNYIINIADIYSNNKNMYGYILIDASDISYLKYIYFVYNDKYMAYNTNYETINIQSLDKDVIGNITNSNICSIYSKHSCSDFSSIKYDESGGKGTFYKNLLNIINETKSTFNGTEKKVYVYDVTTDINNSTNIRGYILINNTVDNPEYYLYLTNDLFMISGYNLTKLGNINLSSTTIRAYNDSAFTLAAESKNKVCLFSGFTECYDKSGNGV